MKNIKYFFLIIGFILLLSLTSCGVNNPGASNNPTTSINNNSPTVNAYMSLTHDHMLTADAIDYLLRADNPGKLSKKALYLLQNYRREIELGAFLEDEADAIAGIPTRPPNHFWDPLRDAPLTDLGNNQSSVPLGKTALVWTKQEYTTAKIGIKEIWPIYNSTVPADTDKIITTMHNVGHVLHLFQDMTSPPHVRNDSHLTIGTLNKFLGMGGISGYEAYVVQGTYTVDPNSLTKIDINKNTVTIQNDDDVWKRFKELAIFTNANFYSEDTIPIPTQALWRWFPQPPLLSLPTNSTMGYIPQTIIVEGKPLQINHFVYAIRDRLNQQVVTYKLTDLVHQDYADILVPKAVEYTASVLAYMLKEPQSPGGLYVMGWNNDAVIIDTQNYTLSDTLTNVGGGGAGMVVNDSTKNLYLNGWMNRSVSILDGATNTASDSISVGGYPYGIGINLYKNMVYVLDNTGTTYEITMIDGDTSKVTGKIPLTNITPTYTPNLAVNAVGINTTLNTAYILNRSYQDLGYISMVNLSTRTELSTIIAINGMFPNGITIDTKRNKAYVVSGFADITYSHGGVSIIDLKTNTEIGVIPLPDRTYGTSIVCDPYSNLIYVGFDSWGAALRGVYIIDGNTYKILSSVQTSGVPWWMVFDQKKGNIYIGNQGWNPSDSVDIISGNAIIKTIPIPTGIQGMAVFNPQ